MLPEEGDEQFESAEYDRKEKSLKSTANEKDVPTNKTSYLLT